jgi:hypothetical protein
MLKYYLRARILRKSRNLDYLAFLQSMVGKMYINGSYDVI